MGLPFILGHFRVTESHLEVFQNQGIVEPFKKERAPGAHSFLLGQWSGATLFQGSGVDSSFFSERCGIFSFFAPL
jgi:hypothetical protein